MRFALKFFWSAMGDEARRWLVIGYTLNAMTYIVDAVLIWVITLAWQRASYHWLSVAAIIVVARIALGFRETFSSQGRAKIAAPRVANEVYRHLMKQDFSFLRREKGRLHETRSRIAGAFQRAEAAAYATCGVGINIIILMVLIILHDPLAAAGFLAWVAVTCLGLWWLSLHRRKLTRQLVEHKKLVEHHASESFDAADRIAAHGITSWSLAEHQRLTKELEEITVQRGRQVAAIWVYITFTIDLATLGLCIGGVWLVQQGRVGAEVAVFIVVYFLRLGRLIASFHMSVDDLQEVLETVELLRDTITQEPTVTSPPESEKPDEDGTVELKDVAVIFGDRRIFNGLSLMFQSGTVTAIIGPSGSGKSTLLGLIQRLYPAEGMVRIGGQDVTSLDVEEHRRRIGWASNEPAFFSGTIRESVRKLNPAASDSEIEKALWLTQLHKEVQGLGGLEADVAGLFSTGQRQRLELTRCVLKQAHIVLLDEATANLDAKMAPLVMQGVIDHCRSAGRTLIFVTHDLALAALAERVVRLEEGRVTFDGPFHGI